ncbi:guanylyl cyclase, partial [Cystoisospora suis]
MSNSTPSCSLSPCPDSVTSPERTAMLAKNRCHKADSQDSPCDRKFVNSSRGSPSVPASRRGVSVPDQWAADTSGRSRASTPIRTRHMNNVNCQNPWSELASPGRIERLGVVTVRYGGNGSCQNEPAIPGAEAEGPSSGGQPRATGASAEQSTGRRTLQRESIRTQHKPQALWNTRRLTGASSSGFATGHEGSERDAGARRHGQKRANREGRGVVAQQQQHQLLREKQEKLRSDTELLATPQWDTRQVIINPVDEDELGRYRDNSVSTHRYEWWTFLPGVLLAHFRRSVPLIHLVLCILELPPLYLIDILMPTGSAPTQKVPGFALLVVLFSNLFVFLVGELQIELRARHTDRLLNCGTTCHVLDGHSPRLKEWKSPSHQADCLAVASAQIPWHKVRVGNIVRVYCDEAFPADSLLLNTGTKEDCLVETSVSDGGRDFQRKSSMRETKSDLSLHALSALRGRVACEAPGQSKQNFKGSFKLDAHPRASHISSDQFAFRGSILRFTPHVDCVVLYTGRDSYAIRTMPSRSSCRGRFERLVDRCILVLWLCFCALTLLVQGVAWLTTPVLRKGAAATAPFSGESPFLHAVRTLLENLVSSTLVLPLGLYVFLDMQRVFTPAVLYRRRRETNREGSRNLARSELYSWQATSTTAGVSDCAAAPPLGDCDNLGFSGKKDEGREGLVAQSAGGNSATNGREQASPLVLQCETASFAWSLKSRPAQTRRRSPSELDLPVRSERMGMASEKPFEDMRYDPSAEASKHLRSHTSKGKPVSVHTPERAGSARGLPRCRRFGALDPLEVTHSSSTRSDERPNLAPPESLRSLGKQEGYNCPGNKLATFQDTRSPSKRECCPASSEITPQASCRCCAAEEGTNGGADARRGSRHDLKFLTVSSMSVRAVPKRVIDFLTHQLGLNFCAALDSLEHRFVTTSGCGDGPDAAMDVPLARPVTPSGKGEPYGLIRNSHCLSSLGVVDFAFLAAPATRQFSFAACSVGGVLYGSRDSGVRRRLLHSGGEHADNQGEKEVDTWSLTVNCSRHGPVTSSCLCAPATGFSSRVDETAESDGTSTFMFASAAHLDPSRACSHLDQAQSKQNMKDHSYECENEVSRSRSSFHQPPSPSTCLCIVCQFGASGFLTDYIGNGPQRRRLQEMGRALAVCNMAESCHAGNLVTASPACCPQSGPQICPCTSACGREFRTSSGGGNLLPPALRSPILSQATSASPGWSPTHAAGDTTVAPYAQPCRWECDRTSRGSCHRSVTACSCGYPAYPYGRNATCHASGKLPFQELSVGSCNAGSEKSETAKVVFPSVSGTLSSERVTRLQTAPAAVCAGFSLGEESSLDTPLFCACEALRSNRTEAGCPGTPISPYRHVCGAWEVAAAAAVAAAANSARLPVVEEHGSRPTRLLSSAGAETGCTGPGAEAAGSLERRPSQARRTPDAELSGVPWSSRGIPRPCCFSRRASAGSRRASGDHSSADGEMRNVTQQEGRQAPRCPTRSAARAGRRLGPHALGDFDLPLTLRSESPADLCLLQFAALLGYLPVIRSPTEVVVRCHSPSAVVILPPQPQVNPHSSPPFVGVSDPVAIFASATRLSADSTGQLGDGHGCDAFPCWPDCQRPAGELYSAKGACAGVAARSTRHGPGPATVDGLEAGVQHEVLPDKLELTIGSPLPPPAVDAELRAPLAFLLRPLVKDSSDIQEKAEADHLPAVVILPENLGAPIDKDFRGRRVTGCHPGGKGVVGHATPDEVRHTGTEVQRVFRSPVITRPEHGSDALEGARAQGRQNLRFSVSVASSAGTREADSRTFYSHCSPCATPQPLCGCGGPPPLSAAESSDSAPAAEKEVGGADLPCLCSLWPPRLSHRNGRPCCAGVCHLHSALPPVTPQVWEPFLLDGQGTLSSHNVQGFKAGLLASVTAPFQRESQEASRPTPGPCREQTPTSEQPAASLQNGDERPVPALILSAGSPTYERFRVLGVHPPEPGRLRMSIIVREEGARDAVLYTRGDLADIGPRCSFLFDPESRAPDASGGQPLGNTPRTNAQQVADRAISDAAVLNIHQGRCVGCDVRRHGSPVGDMRWKVCGTCVSKSLVDELPSESEGGARNAAGEKLGEPFTNEVERFQNFVNAAARCGCSVRKQFRSAWPGESSARIVQGSSSRGSGMDTIRSWCAGGSRLPPKRTSVMERMLKCILRNAELLIKDGLRPLIVARRVLTEEQVEAYQQAVEDAKGSMFSQKSKLCAAIRGLEQDFELLGVAAVKENFEPEVRDIVKDLQDVGVRVWLLTGDSEASAMAVASRSGLLGPACASGPDGSQNGIYVRPKYSSPPLGEILGGRPRSFLARLRPRWRSSGSRTHLSDPPRPAEECPIVPTGSYAPSNAPVKYHRGQQWKIFRLTSIFSDLYEASSSSKAARRSRFGRSRAPQLDCSSRAGGLPLECARRDPASHQRDSSRTSFENESEPCDRSIKSRGMSKVFDRRANSELHEGSRSGRRRVAHAAGSESWRPRQPHGRRRRQQGTWGDDGTDQSVVVEELRKMVAADDTRTRLVTDLGFLLLSRFRRFLEGATAADGLCLVLNGDDLDVFLDNKDLQALLVSVAARCDSVVAYGLTPKQKAALVQGVRASLEPPPTTLAVGHGWADGPMLQQADVGVLVLSSPTTSSERGTRASPARRASLAGHATGNTAAPDIGHQRPLTGQSRFSSSPALAEGPDPGTGDARGMGSSLLRKVDGGLRSVLRCLAPRRTARQDATAGLLGLADIVVTDLGGIRDLLFVQGWHTHHLITQAVDLCFVYCVLALGPLLVSILTGLGSAGVDSIFVFTFVNFFWSTLPVIAVYMKAVELPGTLVEQVRLLYVLSRRAYGFCAKRLLLRFLQTTLVASVISVFIYSFFVSFAAYGVNVFGVSDMQCMYILLNRAAVHFYCHAQPSTRDSRAFFHFTISLLLLALPFVLRALLPGTTDTFTGLAELRSLSTPATWLCLPLLYASEFVLIRLFGWLEQVAGCAPIPNLLKLWDSGVRAGLSEQETAGLVNLALDARLLCETRHRGLSGELGELSLRLELKELCQGARLSRAQTILFRGYGDGLCSAQSSVWRPEGLWRWSKELSQAVATPGRQRSAPVASPWFTDGDETARVVRYRQSPGEGLFDFLRARAFYQLPPPIRFSVRGTSRTHAIVSLAARRDIVSKDLAPGPHSVGGQSIESDMALIRRRDMELRCTLRRPSVGMLETSSCSIAGVPSHSIVAQRTRFAVDSPFERDASIHTIPAQSRIKQPRRRRVRTRSLTGLDRDVEAASGLSMSQSDDCSRDRAEVPRRSAAGGRSRQVPDKQTIERVESMRAKEIKEREEGLNTARNFTCRHGREDDGGGKKVLRVGELMNRLTLRFQDVGLEADYQAARKKEIRRYRTVYRVSLVILLFFCSIDICYRGTQVLRMPSRSAVELLAVAIPHFPFLLLLCATFTDRLFIDNFDGTVSALILTFIFAKCISDYYTVRAGANRQREILDTMLPSFVVDKMLCAQTVTGSQSTSSDGTTAVGLPPGPCASCPFVSPPLYLTVLFCDIADFHMLVCTIPRPQDLVKLLDALFLCFDKLADHFSLVKIETVFETYLAAAGLQQPDKMPLSLTASKLSPRSSQDLSARWSTSWNGCGADHLVETVNRKTRRPSRRHNWSERFRSALSWFGSRKVAAESSWETIQRRRSGSNDGVGDSELSGQFVGVGPEGAPRDVDGPPHAPSHQRLGSLHGPQEYFDFWPEHPGSGGGLTLENFASARECAFNGIEMALAMLQVCQYITYEVPCAWDTAPPSVRNNSVFATGATSESQGGIPQRSETATRERHCASLRQSDTAVPGGSRPVKKMERVRVQIGMHSGPVIR